MAAEHRTTPVVEQVDPQVGMAETEDGEALFAKPHGVEHGGDAGAGGPVRSEDRPGDDDAPGRPRRVGRRQGERSDRGEGEIVFPAHAHRAPLPRRADDDHLAQDVLVEREEAAHRHQRLGRRLALVDQALVGKMRKGEDELLPEAPEQLGRLLGGAEGQLTGLADRALPLVVAQLMGKNNRAQGDHEHGRAAEQRGRQGDMPETRSRRHAACAGALREG